jgi:hypothetical protein
MRDILKNSGLTRFRGSPYGRTVVSPNGLPPPFPGPTPAMHIACRVCML